MTVYCTYEGKRKTPRCCSSSHARRLTGVQGRFLALLEMTIWGKAVFSYRHPERSERSLPFAVRDSRFLHMCRALLRFSHLSFIPLEPYPARYARHLPHAGKALSVVILFPHMRVFALTLWGKRYSRIVAFPIGEGGPRQRWIGYFR